MLRYTKEGTYLGLDRVEAVLVGSMLLSDGGYDRIPYILGRLDDEAVPEGSGRCLISNLRVLVRERGLEALMDDDQGPLLAVLSRIPDREQADVTMLLLRAFECVHKRTLARAVADRLQVDHMRRVLVLAGLAAAQCGATCEESLLEAYQELEAAVSDGKGRLAQASDLTPLGAAQGATEDVDVLSTGIEDLDHVLGGGFERGCYCVIGARTSQGKSTMAMSLAVGMLRLQPKLRVLYVNLEMLKGQVELRMLANVSRCPVSVIRDISPGAEQRVAIDDAGALMSGWGPRWFWSSAGDCSAVRAAAAEVRPDVVVVDYIQLLRPAPGVNAANRQLEVSNVSLELRRLATETGAIVLAPAQLSRAADQDSKLHLGHLRESGSLESDASIVLLLKKSETGDYANAEMDVDVAKNRQTEGRTGSVTLRWDMPCYHVGPKPYGEPVKVGWS